MSKSITIALDVMSGDNGPEAALNGAVKSLENHNDLNVILVGDKKIINIFTDNLDSSIKNA